MSFKQRNSPIKMSMMDNLKSTVTNVTMPYQPNTVTSSLVNNAIAQTPISPKAFSNANEIARMYGQNNPGTFTRTVGQSPFMQVDIDPLTGQPINPLASQSPTQPLIPDVGSAMSPTPPPVGVQQQISPFYDLSN